MKNIKYGDEIKSIILDISHINGEVTVNTSTNELRKGSSPEEMLNFLNSKNLTSKQKKMYNNGIVKHIKEFWFDMAKCSEEIEKNNKIWETRIQELELVIEKQGVTIEKQGIRIQKLQQALDEK